MKFKEQSFEIPAVALELGFEDRSWHNDAAAWMLNQRLHLGLWVAQEKPEDREHPEMARYGVILVDADGTPVEDANQDFIEVFAGESDSELREFMTTRAQEETIEKIAEVAQERFWSFVAEVFNNSPGDFDPMAAHMFDRECQSSVRLWMHWNVKDYDVKFPD